MAAALGGPRRAAADELFLPFQAPDRPEALRFVTEFEKKSKAGDWPGAVDKLQQFLDLPADQPVVLRAPGFVPARFEGTRVIGERLFKSLPPEGLAAWEKLSRPRAEELLGRGLRLRREADLREAARRFPVADVRRRAHEALAQLALVRSDLGAAQFQLESLYEVSSPAERPEVIARLAWVCAQTGDDEAFARVRGLAEQFKDVRVPTGDATAALSEFVAKMQRALAAGAAAWADVRQYGGDSHGSGVSDAPPKPDVVRGRFATEYQSGQLNENEPFAGEQERQQQRPVAPVVAHGRVIAANGLSVFAVDLSSVGLDASSNSAAWRFDAPQYGGGPYWRDSFLSWCAPAVADGVVYAALAARSDAPSIDLYFAGHVIIYPLPHRCLYALDERSGEVLWSHDPSRLAGREDAAEMSKESVASPPLVVGDDVIVSTWTYEGIYDVRLVCFDRRTGRTRWRTSLVQGQQEMNLFGRPVKEMVTSPLAERGGRVYFATGLGAMAAVEREDGRIAWISAYSQIEVPRAQQWFETRDRKITWWPSPVSATPDGVVAAPLDSSVLVCYDLDTGKTRWTQKRQDASIRGRWFLGATGGRAYVLGDRAGALDLKTGKPAWTESDAGRLAPARNQTEEAAGAAVLTKDRLYVPTRSAIVVLSADNGSIVETWPYLASVQGPAPSAGNLVSAEGALLVVNRDRIDVVYRPEDLRARYQARLKQTPDDPQVCLEAGQAFAADGKFDEAIAALDAGLTRIAPLAPRVRDRLDASLRRALYQARVDRSDARRRTKDLSGAADDLRAAATAAREKGDAVRALFALADVLVEAGRRDESETALRRVVAEFGDVVTATDGGDRAAAGALAMFRLGESALAGGKRADAVARWLDLLEQRADDDLGATDVATAVHARLAEFAKDEPALVASAVHERAKKALDRAKAAGDVGGLDRVARLYPDDVEAAAESAMLAAEMHVAAGRPREAVAALSSLLSVPRAPDVAGRALWRLSLAYRALGETARERVTLRRLGEEAASVAVDGAATGADVSKRELAESRFHAAKGRLPDPKPPLAFLWQAGGADQLAPQPRIPVGASDEEMAGRIVLTRSGAVSLVDVATGRAAWEQATKVEARNVFGTPGAVVVVGEDGSTREKGVVVIALAIADGREVWRKRMVGRYWKADAALGVLYLLQQIPSAVPGGGRPTNGLTALSLSTGEILGATKTFGALQPQIVPAEDAVVVVETPLKKREGIGRSLVVLDGMSLSLRGRLDLGAPSSPFYAHPPLSNVVVSSDGDGDLVAVDATTGETAWRPPARLAKGVAVKAVFPTAAGLVVTDSSETVRLFEASSGRERWNVPLATSGVLMFEGAAADGDTVVVTVKPEGNAPATAVALDVASGKERWRRPLPLDDENAFPHPKVLANHVAYEIWERLEGGARSRSRVLLLDRADGRIVQQIEHPTIGRSVQSVVYGPDWIAVNSTNELAVYGRPDERK